MTIKLSKLLVRFSVLSLITLVTVYASGVMSQTKDMTQMNYQKMSTLQLQKEVEERSVNGTLPFPMGIELIKRWSEVK